MQEIFGRFASGVIPRRELRLLLSSSTYIFIPNVEIAAVPDTGVGTAKGLSATRQCRQDSFK